jgi:hypothetical protein
MSCLCGRRALSHFSVRPNFPPTYDPILVGWLSLALTACRASKVAKSKLVDGLSRQTFHLANNAIQVGTSRQWLRLSDLGHIPSGPKSGDPIFSGRAIFWQERGGTGHYAGTARIDDSAHSRIGS